MATPNPTQYMQHIIPPSSFDPSFHVDLSLNSFAHLQRSLH